MSTQTRPTSYHEYLASAQWQTTRALALSRAGHRCQVCNAPTSLDVHHRTYERLGEELPSDLTVLCRHCHTIFHRSSRVLPAPPSARVSGIYNTVLSTVTMRPDGLSLTCEFSVTSAVRAAPVVMPRTIVWEIPKSIGRFGHPNGGSRYRAVLEALLGRRLHRGEHPDIVSLIGRSLMIQVEYGRDWETINIARHAA